MSSKTTTSKTIPYNQQCKLCEKDFYIGDLEICNKCKKILCTECRIKLARTTDEVNHEYHYLCKDKTNKHDEPGVFVKVYNA